MGTVFIYIKTNLICVCVCVYKNKLNFLCVCVYISGTSPVGLILLRQCRFIVILLQRINVDLGNIKLDANSISE